jgi:DNA (cytosine-5)-methyltransferase 1
MSGTCSTVRQIDGSDQRFLRRKKRSNYANGGTAVRLVDLFAGCGGLTLGVAEACRELGRSLDVRLAVELVPEMWSVYDANFPEVYPRRASDIFQWLDGRVAARTTNRERTTRMLVGPTTVVVGGPPCQGHSTLNNHTRGDDPKNALYERMVRAAEVLEPETLLIENVPSLARDRAGVLERSVMRLERLGYSVTHDVVRLSDLGTAQLRSRHVLVATTEPAPATLARAPHLRLSRTLRWAIGDLKCTLGTLFNSAANLSPENEQRARWLLENDKYDLPNWLRPPCHQDPGHKYKSMYGRLDWDKPAQTVTTGFGSPGQGRYLHPSEPRTLTPHEAARLQFFPDWYDFAGVTKRNRLQDMIGNAVPPKLSYLLTLDVLGDSTVHRDGAYAAHRSRTGP